ncbi:MAG: hypothetical protein P8O00_04950 [Candidatus Marinimicrobia bacterium]|nr:hypothetical protein [Candidatus Neomarinimicrobiota bacterium]
MKKILFLALVYFIPVNAQNNPCYDDLYLSLKANGLNAMTTREYHYFTRKDEECSEYNTFDKKYYNQLSEMQNEIYRIAEKIGELDEDISLENIYGLGRLKATDPELRSLAIMQSKDNDIRNEFNTLLEKLIVLKKEIKEEKKEDVGPTDLVVNSLTVIDSSNGGYIRTISKDGKNTVMIGNHPSGSGSVITYNLEGAPSVRIGSDGKSDGYMNVKRKSGKNALFVGVGDDGNNVIVSSNSKGNPSIVAGVNEDDNGYLKTINNQNNSSIIISSKKDGSGYLSTFNNSGKRSSFISSDRNGNGMIGLYDKDQKLQYSQKGIKPVINEIPEDKKK